MLLGQFGEEEEEEGERKSTRCSPTVGLGLTKSNDALAVFARRLSKPRQPSFGGDARANGEGPSGIVTITAGVNSEHDFYCVQHEQS
jgi:hypothetical protein